MLWYYILSYVHLNAEAPEHGVHCHALGLEYDIIAYDTMCVYIYIYLYL